jgi:hypothetical protein
MATKRRASKRVKSVKMTGDEWWNLYFKKYGHRTQMSATSRADAVRSAKILASSHPNATVEICEIVHPRSALLLKWSILITDFDKE